MSRRLKYLHYLAFLLITVIAFWQIAFYWNPVKYDMVDCYYPWRYFIGQCLQSSQLPLWNPYQNLGSPIHADPSSGIWYPFVWIIGLSSGYDLKMMGIEYLAHIFFAAVGFYKLCGTFRISQWPAFLCATGYMLSGLFTGNAQHLTYVASACWLPYVLNYFIRTARETNVLNPLKGSVFLFLMITGGYPAFTIILFYLLLILAAWYSFRFWRRSEKRQLLLFYARCALFVVVALLLSAAMLTAVMQVSSFITRTNQFPLHRALFSPFSPQSAISFILPFGTVKSAEFFDTDMSMSNAYIGGSLFLMALLALFRRKEGELKILFWFGIFALLASFGKYLPVREFLFHYVPGMNLFRFPSVFRLFVIIALLLCAARWMQDYLTSPSAKPRKSLITLACSFALALLGLIVALRLNDYINIRELLGSGLFRQAPETTLCQHLVLQAAIQIIFFCLLAFTWWKVQDKQQQIRFTGLLLIADLLLATQLNAPYTVYGETSVGEADAHIKKFPAGFPLLKDQNIADVNPHEVYKPPFWKNVNIFQKQISADGFNSFAFTAFEELRDEHPNLYSTMIHNRPAYLTNCVLSYDSIELIEHDSLYTRNMIFTDEASGGGRLCDTSMGTVHLTDFSPGRFTYNVSSPKEQMLVLQQNFYTGWQVSVNGVSSDPEVVNYSLMAVRVPSGESLVVYSYENPLVRNMAIVSAIALLGCILAIVFLQLRTSAK